MKKLILLALSAVIMAGCFTDGYEIHKSSHAFADIIYDSCEYVMSSVTERMAHKGNCKFCEHRDSIKWEKRKQEIINELKK
jgi:hypothetical protein